MYYFGRRYIYNDPTTFFVIWEVKRTDPLPVSKNVERIVFVKKIKDDDNEFQVGYHFIDDKKKIVENPEDVIKEIFK